MTLSLPLKIGGFHANVMDVAVKFSASRGPVCSGFRVEVSELVEGIRHVRDVGVRGSTSLVSD